jgi:hypothetical protein
VCALQRGKPPSASSFKTDLQDFRTLRTINAGSFRAACRSFSIKEGFYDVTKEKPAEAGRLEIEIFAK